MISSARQSIRSILFCASFTIFLYFTLGGQRIEAKREEQPIWLPIGVGVEVNNIRQFKVVTNGNY